MLARSMATVKSSIGDKKVPMSNLESGKFVNYQRIEDNLQVVRSR
jgi:aconitate hydratase